MTVSERPLLKRLEAMLASGQDSALLRFSLGSEYLQAGDPIRAQRHLQAAVGQKPDYSAAWKLLGNSLSVPCVREVLAAVPGLEAARRGPSQAEAVSEIRSVTS